MSIQVFEGDGISPAERKRYRYCWTIYAHESKDYLYSKSTVRVGTRRWTKDPRQAMRFPTQASAIQAAHMEWPTPTGLELALAVLTFKRIRA